jgi:hypothetical protein
MPELPCPHVCYHHWSSFILTSLAQRVDIHHGFT